MSPDPNAPLIEERTWLSVLLNGVGVEITDVGVGMGQADLCYERNLSDDGYIRRRVSISLRIETLL